MFTIQIDTLSGSRYAITYAGHASEWGDCTTNTQSPWVSDHRFEVRMADVFATVVGQPFCADTRIDKGSHTVEGPLKTTEVVRILHVLAYAETHRGDMLPMVTNRCDCGTIVNLAEPYDQRTWITLRIKGDSGNGYEPMCETCSGRAEEEMVTVRQQLERNGIQVMGIDEVIAGLTESDTRALHMLRGGREGDALGVEPADTLETVDDLIGDINQQRERALPTSDEVLGGLKASNVADQQVRARLHGVPCGSVQCAECYPGLDTTTPLPRYEGQGE